MLTGWLFITIIIPVLITYIWYIVIVKRKNKAGEALSGIDVQFQKRANLIPNILTIAQKFMTHERSLHSEIVALRTQTQESYNPEDPAEVSRHLADAGKLSGKIAQLMINVENHPDLKSDATMLQAQRTYNEVELQIAAARRFYNTSVNQLNNSVQIFPGNLIAYLAKVVEMPFYESSDGASTPVNANDFLT